MQPMTQEWLDKAEGDANVVIALWQMAPPVYDAICFHAQQCAEKYCKAWLVERHVDFPRTTWKPWKALPALLPRAGCVHG